MIGSTIIRPTYRLSFAKSWPRITWSMRSPSSSGLIRPMRLVLEDGRQHDHDLELVRAEEGRDLAQGLARRSFGTGVKSARHACARPPPPPSRHPLLSVSVRAGTPSGPHLIRHQPRRYHGMPRWAASAPDRAPMRD